MPETESFDAVVIGTGQGGKPLAGALAEAGWHTAIVERGRIGGTCVVCGCTPTKTMVASARVAPLARRAGDDGIETGPVSVDMEVVRRRKREIVDQWSDGSRKGLERHDTLELIRGEARFATPREVVVEDDEGGERWLSAPRVFINAGARPRIPSLPGLDDIPWLDSTAVMELGRVPEHLVVLGGGFIGLEFGQMFRRFGARVTLVERSDRLASREDADVSEAIAEIFEEDGVEVHTGAEAVRVERPGDGASDGRSGGARDGGVALVLDVEGGEARIEGSHLLVAAGRQPNSDALALENAGIETDPRGYIPVDERCHTEADGIWALGDITGAPPFTHTAYDDFRVIRDELFGDGERTTADRVLPYTVFIDPQLGRVGMTEREAREEGYDVRTAKLPMSRVARAIEMDETRGFMKAVVNADDDRILGASVLGIEGGEVVSVLQTAMMGDLPYTALRDAMLPHPTLAESLNNLFMTLD